MVALGLGVERRYLATFVKGIGANPLIDRTPRAQTRPYAEAIAEVVFNPGELRTDRKHLLDVEARAYTGSPSSEQAVWLRLLEHLETQGPPLDPPDWPGVVEVVVDDVVVVVPVVVPPPVPVPEPD